MPGKQKHFLSQQIFKKLALAQANMYFLIKIFGTLLVALVPLLDNQAPSTFLSHIEEFIFSWKHYGQMALRIVSAAASVSGDSQAFAGSTKISPG